MQTKVKVDRYKIEPYEAAELIEAYGSRQKALDAAIDICRERAKLYVMPCQWEAHFAQSGLTIIVTRTRNA